MKESSNIILNEQSKIHPKKSNKRKKSILEYNKIDKNLNDTTKRKKKTFGFYSILAI